MAVELTDTLGATRNSRAARATARRVVVAARRRMLASLETYSVNQITAALDAMTANTSHDARVLRRSDRLFGIRAGARWRYPKFQFDSAQRLYPQMRQVLIRLPDEDGWQRLAWFLTPNQILNRHTPLDVWSFDRDSVVQAAIAQYRPPDSGVDLSV